jgi:hypothetical protein
MAALLDGLRELVGEASVATAAGRQALRTRLRKQLDRITSVEELRKVARQTIGGDPVEGNESLFVCGSARKVVIDALVDRFADGAVGDEDEDEDDALPPEVLDAWLSSTADTWPEDAPGPPPSSSAEALDPIGVWGMEARGVEVRACADAAKGMGCFATRDVAAGAFVGLYWGEALTKREYALRHGWKNGEYATQITAAEATRQAERRERLAALTTEQGAPMGGVDNGGSCEHARLRWSERCGLAL